MDNTFENIWKDIKEYPEQWNNYLKSILNRGEDKETIEIQNINSVKFIKKNGKIKTMIIKF